MKLLYCAHKLNNIECIIGTHEYYYWIITSVLEYEVFVLDQSRIGARKSYR